MPDTPTVTPLVDELLPCPFCGGEAERITIGDDEPNNAGGDVIFCTRCQASSHVEFGYKENLVSRWNTRAALRPVEADDAGLIERAINHTRLYNTPATDDPRRRYTRAQMEIAIRKALASLSAAKVEAEKEVERLLEKLRIKIVPGDKVVLEDEAALKGRAQGDGED